MLELKDFSCGYDQVRAVEDLNIHIQKGEVFALLGPNGAGKTSTILAIMGHVKTQRGQIFLEGRDITHMSPVNHVSCGLALVPEGRRLFSDLSVEDNLTVGGYAFSKSQEKTQREEVYALFPVLFERRRQLAYSLSGGEQQMLSIARALMTKPKLLLVDELSLGLMPKMVNLCMEVLITMRDRGITILLVEQDTNRALEIADHVCVLASGVMVYKGAAAEVRANEDIFEKYLGLGD
jgi:branched-chain amino acid transport system ATP-binding protein